MRAFLVLLGITLVSCAGASANHRAETEPATVGPDSTDATSTSTGPEAASPPRAARSDDDPPSSGARSTEHVTNDDMSGCSGRLPVEPTLATVQEDRDAIRKCYESELREDAELRARIAVDVRVSRDGRVVGARVSGAPTEGMRECIRSVALTWQFSQPSNGSCAIVHAPFVFKPKPSETGDAGAEADATQDAGVPTRRPNGARDAP